MSRIAMDRQKYTDIIILVVWYTRMTG